MEDQILLDRIKELEEQNKNLKALTRKTPVSFETIRHRIIRLIDRWENVFTPAFVAVFWFAMLVGPIAFIAGGWATNHFYVTHSEERTCIYQRYDWGLDARVECKWGSFPDLSERMKATEYQWQELNHE